MFLSTPLDASTASFFSPQTLSTVTGKPTIDGLISIAKGDSQLQRWSSLIGIITAIVGNILISFALNIQRYAHIRLHDENVRRRDRLKSSAKVSISGYGTSGTNGTNGQERHQQDRQDDSPSRSFQSTNSNSTACLDDDHKQDSTYLRSPYWWGGIILMTVGEAGNFLAYGFAPASIVSPLGVVALVSNCVIAPIMLKEQFRLRDFWGVVVAVGGAVTVVLSAKTSEKKFGAHEILGAITTTEFEVYMGITAFLIIVLMWASPRYGSKTILVDLGLVGLFGGYTALSTKGVASMLSYTLWRALTTPITYALLAVLIGTAIMQVKYVNRALQRFDSTQVIPVQFVMFTLSVIIGSAILYRDFEKVTAENMGKFVGGCVLTFFGVWLITSGRLKHDGNDEEDDSDEEGEERIGLANQAPSGEENQALGGPQARETKYTSSSSQSKTEIKIGGDGGYDSDMTDSRRSSRVSFTDPSSRPRTPRIYSNSPNQNSLRHIPSSLEPEQAATEDAPLLGNPWKDVVDDSLLTVRHPGMINMNSSSLLPSEVQTHPKSSLKPPTTSRSATQPNFLTNSNSHQAPTPTQGDRPYTLARHSMSRMLPGPLISPLSGGLSAVVADSLRRGLDSPSRSKSYRRPRLGLRRTKSSSQRLTETRDETEDELRISPLKPGSTAEEVSRSLESEQRTDWSQKTRARSLSNTLGDLFRGKRQMTDGPGQEDEEAGPSRS